MPRAVRIQYPGATYHVMCRGDRREVIFRDDRDRLLFLETLGAACARAGFRVHGYVLMSNHYHLLLETQEANLVEGMRWFQGTYTVRFNARHRLVGHLFQGRYKAIPVEDDTAYLRVVSDYIHLNPARARLLDARQPRLLAYPWSSYPCYVGRKPLPEWLARNRVFAAHDLPNEGASSRRAYAAFMRRRVMEIYGREENADQKAEWTTVRRGWYLGGSTFRDRLLDLAEQVVQGRRRGSYRKEGLAGHDQHEAERLLGSALKALRLRLDELYRLPKNDPRKQAIAWLLRSRTVVSGTWIAETLGMGHISNISRAVSSYRGTGDRARIRIQRKLLHICKD